MTVEIKIGDSRDVLKGMESGSVNCIVTSPPYFGLRDYGVEGQMGLEPTPDEFVAGMVELFREARRVLRDDGTLWLNLGDSYAGSWGAQGHRQTDEGVQGNSIRNHPKTASLTGKIRQSGLKPKDLIGIPWRVAFALQADGWYLRQDIIWHKPNPMPESVRDRCTKAHEYIFMLSKSRRYHYDTDAIKEPRVGDEDARTFRGGAYVNGATFDNSAGGQRTVVGNTKVKADKQRGHSRRHAGFNDRWDQMERTEQISGLRNKRSVWTVAPSPFKGAHFATFPPDLIEPCVLAGCPVGGTVLDPFGGAGTTGLVAQRHGRNAILIELNPEYAAMARARIDAPPPKPKRNRSPKLANDNAKADGHRDIFGAAA